MSYLFFSLLFALLFFCGLRFGMELQRRRHEGFGGRVRAMACVKMFAAGTQRTARGALALRRGRASR